MTRHLPTTTYQATQNQSSSYPQHQPPNWCITKPQIYIPKERRCLNFSRRKTDNHETDFCCSSNQVTKQYGVYTAYPAKKTTSTIRNVKIDKSLKVQVNWLNITRDTSIKARPKNSSKNLKFCIPSVTLTLL